MAALQASFVGKVATPARRVAVATRAEPVDRRAALTGLASVAALVATKPAEAAYGESANVFGKPNNTSGFIPYTGDGFALLLPSKWNPSKERDFQGTVLRYEDNGDAVNNLVVIKVPAKGDSVDAYGPPDAFLSTLQGLGLFGKQSYVGSSRSEGGFADGRYSAASLLDTTSYKDAKGKLYYKYELLVRTADGDEGGRHQVIAAAVGSDGLLNVIKIQIGDKRWFKGAQRIALNTCESFVIA